MTDWKTYKNQKPWALEPQQNEYGYINNSHWATPTPEATEPQIWNPNQVYVANNDESIDHSPCGHWHKGPASRHWHTGSASGGWSASEYGGFADGDGWSAGGDGGGGPAVWSYHPRTPRECIEVKIVYTTNLMNIEETQELTINGANGQDIVWYLYGGGSLSSQVGYSVVYTASATSEIVKITIKCNGYAVDTLSICVGATIHYATRQMKINEEQTLMVIPCTEEFCIPEFTWKITAGGGTLNTDAGISTIYTAPPTNPNCTNNATILLSCGNKSLDTLQIAINTYADNAVAYQIKDLGSCDGPICWYGGAIGDPGDYKGPQSISTCDHYTCSGAHRGHCSISLCCYTQPTDVCESKIDCYTEAPWNRRCFEGPCGTVDMRTADMKTNGCCPEELL